MTGTAGEPLLHLRHGKTSYILAKGEDIIMTVITLEKLGMKFVTEESRTGLLHIKDNLFSRRVTAVALPFYRKSQKSIMAGTAGTVPLHLFHGVTAIRPVRGKKCVVAVTATEHLQMAHMGKSCIKPETDFSDTMALCAVLCHGKGCLPIVTGTAGEALFHLLHGITLALGSGCENFIVTVVTLVHTEMKLMTELYFAGIDRLKGNILRAVMTAVTAPFHRKGNAGIMTGSAGKILLHLPHGVAFAPLAPDENTTVTVIADVHVFRFISMNRMTEERRFLFKADIRQPFVTAVAVTLHRKSIL